MKTAKAVKKRETCVVWIKWVDANQDIPNHMLYKKDMERGIVLESAGILINEDNKFISLAQDCNPNDLSCRTTLHIPKRNIINKQIWEI